MTIIAIDPGTTQSAMLIWDGQVKHAEISPNADIRRRIMSLAAEDRPEILMAVEGLSCYGNPVGKETFETAMFIGRLQEIWEGYAHPLRLVYRRAVMKHLGADKKTRADKSKSDSRVRRALISKFGGIQETKKGGKLYGITSHLWSALAIAVYAEETSC